MATNRCPICRERIPAGRIFCKSHWLRVPKPLRGRIWELYRKAPGSQEHRAAVFEAIRGLLNADQAQRGEP